MDSGRVEGRFSNLVQILGVGRVEGAEVLRVVRGEPRVLGGRGRGVPGRVGGRGTGVEVVLEEGSQGVVFDWLSEVRRLLESALSRLIVREGRGLD